MKKVSQHKQGGTAKSIRFLAYAHTFFFFLGSIFITSADRGETELWLIGFVGTGIFTAICAYYYEKNPIVSGIGGVLAVLFYWVLSILAGLSFGFIRGISFSLIILGVLSLYRIFSDHDQ